MISSIPKIIIYLFQNFQNIQKKWKLSLQLLTKNMHHLFPQPKCIVFKKFRIQSNQVDIANILITEVFLNHHYNIGFYVVKNNIGNQFQLPVKICKQLLDRNQGPVELSIVSNRMDFVLKSESEPDFMELFTKTQFEFYKYQEDQIMYEFKFWEIRVRLIILEAATEKSFTSYISDNPSQYIKVHKLLLFIDATNCNNFANWNYQEKKTNNISFKLEKQYISLKSAIESQKNMFKNKVKLVQALIGESINVQKLLVQEKEENSQFKRLKETFQTIRNIDNIIIEQQKKIQTLKFEFSHLRVEKQEVNHELSLKYIKQCNTKKDFEKSCEMLEYKISRVVPNIEQYRENRSFKPSTSVKQTLHEQIKNFKYNFIKKDFVLEGKSQTKAQSQEQKQNRDYQKYSQALKEKIQSSPSQKRRNVQLSFFDEKNAEYQHLLLNLWHYHTHCFSLLLKVRKKVPALQVNSSRLFFTNFPILQELQDKAKSIIFKKKNKKFRRNTLEQTLVDILSNEDH